MSQVRVDASSGQQSGELAPILSVRDLRVIYTKEKGLFVKKKYLIKALDGVNLDIYPSESIAIVGETGSGKTTLARCIMGLTKVKEGQILFNGGDIRHLRGKKLKAHRRRVQIVYQDPYESLNPLQDVYKTVSTPIRLLAGVRDQAVIDQKVHQVLVDVGLDPREIIHRYPHQLSGGQRQRVNIARALAPEPDMLIADEPVTMLDAEQRINVLTLLRSLKEKRKLTVLMITHDLASARLTNERIVVMYLGKIIETGTASEIVSSPNHPYVELILNSAPRIHSKDSDLDRSTDEIPPMEENIYPTKGCVFAPRCRYATDECRSVEPKLVRSTAAHWYACYHPLNSPKDRT